MLRILESLVLIIFVIFGENKVENTFYVSTGEYENNMRLRSVNP